MGMKIGTLNSIPSVDRKRDRKLALLSILTKFGQWDDLIISQLQAIFSALYVISAPRENFVKLANLVSKPT